MSNAIFRGDCARCAGLCCVALSFERGPHFASDKPAGEACANLDAGHRCAIHSRLQPEGYTGCIAYDCLGAGQLVTAMFRGLSWRDSAAVARQMFRAFALVREIQQTRLALGALTQSDSRDELAALLDPVIRWSYADLLLDAPIALGTVRRKLKAIGRR
jgi:hypothetical protein